MPKDDRKLSLWLTPLSKDLPSELSGVAVYPKVPHIIPLFHTLATNSFADNKIQIWQGNLNF